MQLLEFTVALSIAEETVSRIGGNWRVCVFVGCEDPATTYDRAEGVMPRQIASHVRLVDGQPLLVHEGRTRTDIVSIASVTHVTATN